MHLPVRHLFLDLEDTVITPVMDGWWNTECINVAKVKQIIAGWKPDFVHLFSFAIWNQAQLENFRLGTRTMIEERFGVQLSMEWTTDDDIIPMCCAAMAIERSTVDFQEMSNFWSKHQAFRLCMRQHFKNTHLHGTSVEVMLLDDAVFNEDFHWPDLKLSGRIINIDNPPEF
jgi:hypothetical protein